METVIDFIFSGPKITADGDRSHEIKRHLLFGRKIYDKLRQHIKKQRHLLCLLRKVCIIKAMVLPIVMYGYDSWTIKKAEHWRIDSFEMWCWKRLESPLDSKEIKPVYPKGNQFWVFIGKTDVEVGAPILWPSDVKNWLTGKDPYVKKYWGHEEKGATDYEMVGWHYQCNGHEVKQTPGDSEWQESLACCSTWGYKELAWLNTWTTTGQYVERAQVNIQNWMSKAFVTVDSVFVIYTERGRVFIEFLNSFFFNFFSWKSGGQKETYQLYSIGWFWHLKEKTWFL